jgi:hypothetical protein
MVQSWTLWKAKMVPFVGKMMVIHIGYFYSVISFSCYFVVKSNGAGIVCLLLAGA